MYHVSTIQLYLVIRMRIIRGVIEVATSDRFQALNVTSIIESWVKEQKLSNGLLLVYVPHTTAALTVNEAERGLMSDIVTFLKELTYEGKSWRHNIIDDNAHAHLSSILTGYSIILPVIDGRLDLGTWQQIILLEMDGPRRRKIKLFFMGET